MGPDLPLPGPLGPSRHERVYQTLLLLYPRSFRVDYGEPMAQLFGDRLHDRGWRRTWLEVAPDLLRTVPSQRLEAVMARLNPATRVLALTAAVLGAIFVSVGTGATGLLPVLVAALLLLAGVASQRRRFVPAVVGPRAPLRPAVTQAWWAPLAALLGVVMLVFAVGTVFEAHNLGGRIIGSTVMFAFGACMLLGLMRRPFDRAAGNSMVLLATVPAFTLFWVIVPAVVALVIWVGVLTSGFEAGPGSLSPELPQG